MISLAWFSVISFKKSNTTILAFIPDVRKDHSFWSKHHTKPSAVVTFRVKYMSYYTYKLLKQLLIIGR